jgi:inner membrane protein
VINFSILGFVVILAATLIPDIDAETSKLGRKIKPISQSFRHRGFFHSILFGVLMTGIFYYANSGLYLEFLIGYFSHLLLDLLNYKTVQLFWPFRTKTKGFIKTNGFVEKLLMFIFLVVDVGLVLLILLYSLLT